MVLSFEDIRALIEGDEPEFITTARQEAKVYNLHVNGIGLDKYLTHLEAIETPEQYELKRKIAQGTEALMWELIKPVYKVFRAGGGSLVVSPPDEEVEESVRLIADEGIKGQSLENWLKEIQLNKMFSDPAGVVLVEIRNVTIIEDGREVVYAKSYPTVKDLSSIKSYKTSYRQLEYILFQGETREGIEGKFYRLIDDAFDYEIWSNGDVVEIVEDNTMVNPWGVVPGFTNGFNVGEDAKRIISPADKVTSTLNQYLGISTNEQAHIYNHIHPLYWEYGSVCPTCNGTGKVGGKTCPTCHGKSSHRGASQVKYLQTPSDSEHPTIAPNVAGYVAPPESTPQTLWEKEDRLKEQCFQTFWGTTHQKGNNETATARFISEDHVHDALDPYTHAFQWAHNKILNWVAQAMLPGFEKAVAQYGRRYHFEESGHALDEYMKAREKGAPESLLDGLLINYYHSFYRDQPEELAVMLKLIRVEPWPHLNAAPEVMPGASFQKASYTEWLQEKPTSFLQNSTIEELKSDFEFYVRSKTVNNI